MLTRRGALSMLSAVPVVAKLDLLSADDLAVLRIAAHLDGKDGKSWEYGSEMSDQIQSLAKRGYLEIHGASVHEDGGEIKWYRPSEKGFRALEEARDG